MASWGHAAPSGGEMGEKRRLLYSVYRVTSWLSLKANEKQPEEVSSHAALILGCF